MHLLIHKQSSQQARFAQSGGFNDHLTVFATLLLYVVVVKL